MVRTVSSIKDCLPPMLEPKQAHANDELREKIKNMEQRLDEQQAQFPYVLHSCLLFPYHTD